LGQNKNTYSTLKEDRSSTLIVVCFNIIGENMDY